MSRQKVKIGGFKSPLWKVCGNDYLRPALKGAFVENGNIYATNAYVVVRQSLFHIHDLDKQEVENLEGKWFSKELLKHLEKCEVVQFGKEKIECHLNGVKMEIEYQECPDKFPNCEAVLSGSNKESTDKIGLNSNNVKLITDAMYNGRGDGYFFQFNGRNKGIKIIAIGTLEHEQLGLIMPITSND